MKKTRNRVRSVKHRLSYDALEREFFIDPKNGSDNAGDGSRAKPLRTHHGLARLFDFLEENHHKVARAEYEKHERERTEERAKTETAREVEAAGREAERKAKEKELDDKIAMLEVELTSLEKTYLETQHLFELKQLECMSIGGDRAYEEARALAQQLHLLRMALMERSHEHDTLVKQRKSGQWNPWTLFGGYATYAFLGLAAYALFRGPEKK